MCLALISQRGKLFHCFVFQGVIWFHDPHFMPGNKSEYDVNKILNSRREIFNCVRCIQRALLVADENKLINI